MNIQPVKDGFVLFGSFTAVEMAALALLLTDLIEQYEYFRERNLRDTFPNVAKLLGTLMKLRDEAVQMQLDEGERIYNFIPSTEEMPFLPVEDALEWLFKNEKKIKRLNHLMAERRDT